MAVSALLAMALMGCAPTLHRVTVDPARVVGATHAQVACAYRLGEVVDARPGAGGVGRLGTGLFELADAAEAVRRNFIAAGLVADSGAGDGTPVQVRILQLYVSQNTITKVPVAVYEIGVEGHAPFRLRSQKASLNWNGSSNEALDAYAAALGDATAQTVARLNAMCGSRGS